MKIFGIILIIFNSIQQFKLIRLLQKNLLLIVDFELNSKSAVRNSVPTVNSNSIPTVSSTAELLSESPNINVNPELVSILA